MKSLCVKDSKSEVIDFIRSGFLKIDLKETYVTTSEFKLYKNVIIHYKGDSLPLFYDKVSDVLTSAIITFYQDRLLKRVLEYNYFYFDSSEKKEILKTAKLLLENEQDIYFDIFKSIIHYIKENKSIVLEGFVNFRIRSYIKKLEYIIDLSVNKYITDKEYNEFVNMLKMYIMLTPPKANIIHLVYLNR